MFAPSSDHVHRDIVVVGASAGGVEALSRLVAGLPARLPAALFVVLHIPAASPSSLSAILSRAGSLPAVAARDDSLIERGTIYVAPPDHHLLLTAERIRVVRGPRENRQRPAADPLFRSAALAFGPRVIGVVLSGAMNDGTAGLLAIKRAGGMALVQDPATALFADMPISARRHVAIDWSLPVPALAQKLVELVADDVYRQGEGRVMADEMSEAQKTDLRFEADIAGLDARVQEGTYRPGHLTSLTCPDCHGPLWEIRDGSLLRFRCRVGHAFTAGEMLAGQRDQVEEALWVALNALEESRQLHTRLAAQFAEGRHARIARQYSEKAREFQRRAEVIRRLLAPEPEAAREDEPTGTK